MERGGDVPPVLDLPELTPSSGMRWSMMKRRRFPQNGNFDGEIEVYGNYYMVCMVIIW